MSTAHFIYGSTGAGKTTKSLEIAKKEKAIVFSIDEWMKNLFWKDAPDENTLDWALERVRRCEDQIWSLAQNILSNGTTVVFDLGFSKRTQREKFRKLISESGFKNKVHFLDVDVEERRQRVHKRNKSLKENQQSIEVNDDTFDWMESFYEKPGTDEI